MFASEVLLGFFAASVLLSLAPGPDNLFVLAQSALGGRMAGLAVTLGLSTGLIGHTTAVAIGVAAISSPLPLPFTCLSWLAPVICCIWPGVRSALPRRSCPIWMRNPRANGNSTDEASS